MAQPAAGRNVLTALDESPPTSFYWQLTLLAALGGFLFGYDTSNIGSALNFVPYGLHGLAQGYLVSGRRWARPQERSWPARQRTGLAAKHCSQSMRVSTPPGRSCPRLPRTSGCCCSPAR
jgi:hypothetical protein